MGDGVSSICNATEVAEPEFFSAPSSPCWQQDMGNTSLNYISSAQRARMDHNKAIALARRTIKLQQQRASQNLGPDRPASMGNHVTQAGEPSSSQHVVKTQPLQQKLYGATLPQNEKTLARPKVKLQQCQQQVQDQNLYKSYINQCALPDGVTSSFTYDQRNRMVQEKEKALARRQEKFRQCRQQVQDEEHYKSYMSQCSGEIFYKNLKDHDFVRCSDTAQSSQSGCDGPPLTYDQRVHMAREKEKALARRHEKLQQRQQHAQNQGDNKAYMSRCSGDIFYGGHGDLQGDVVVGSLCTTQASQSICDGPPLTYDQRVRLAMEKEKALARRHEKLQQCQQQAQDQDHNKSFMSRCSGDIFYAGDLQGDVVVGSLCTTQASQSGCDGHPLTSDQRARMNQEKERLLRDGRRSFNNVNNRCRMKTTTSLP
ncbi:hypothetical protein L7F22_007622 [Adiantum nelumboides]|nr:hypothetical protein [Adiantum nelumboides]